MSAISLQVLSGVVLAGACALANAVQVQLGAAKDSTLFSDRVDFASGAGDFLFIGNTASGSTRRALLAFDLSPIPVNAQITSASLTIFVDRNAIASSPTDQASLHSLSADWGEGGSNAGTGGGGTQATPADSTWAFRRYGDPPALPQLAWATPGGDFTANASATVALSSVGTISFASSAALVADVQGWLDQPAGNFGWIMLGNESSDQNARRFLSRTSMDIGNRPRLDIEYVAAIPEPATTAMWVVGLAALALRSMRRSPAG